MEIGKKIKKSLSNLIKKKTLLLISLFGFLFLLTPSKSHADWVGDLVGAVTNIPGNIIKYILKLGVLALSSIAETLNDVLVKLLDGSIISFSYVYNPITKVGLSITQSFVNMGLVLILIVIAFATILRIQEYGAKKLFVRLIIIALLVNFAPLICGLVVDAGNITTNYFLTGITKDGSTSGLNNLNTESKNQVDKVNRELNTSWKWEASGNAWENVATTLFLVFYNIFLIFILLAYCLIFLIRYVAIWTIVILSPLAFLCYILPSTKKIFSQWWKQLIEWSFVGAIASFFIFLAENMAVELSKAIKDSTVEISVITLFFPIIFLVIGFIVATKTSAMGADFVIKGFEKRGKQGLSWTGKKAVGTAKSKARQAREKTPKQIKKVLTSMSKWPGVKWGENQKGLGGTVKRGFAGAVNKTVLAIPRYVTRGTGSLGQKMMESDIADKNKAEEEAKKKNPDRLAQIMKTSGSWLEKIGTITGAIKNGKIDDLKDAGVTENEIAQTAVQALKTGFDEDYKAIIRNSSASAEKIWERIEGNKELEEKSGLKITEEDEKKGITDVITKAIDKFIKKPGDIDKYNMSMPEKEEEKKKLIAGFIKTKDSRFISKLGTNFGKAFVEPFQEIINGIEIKEPGWIKNNLPALYKYLSGNGARNLGIGVPTKEERKENEEEYQNNYNQNETVINNIIKGEKPTDKKEISRIIQTPELPQERHESEVSKPTEFTKDNAEKIRKSPPSKNKKPGGTEK
jgi:hypothetical protein